MYHAVDSYVKSSSARLRLSAAQDHVRRGWPGIIQESRMNRTFNSNHLLDMNKSCITMRESDTLPNYWTCLLM